MKDQNSIKAYKELELVKKKIKELLIKVVALDQYFYSENNNLCDASLCSKLDSMVKELNERQRLLINLRKVPSNSGFSRNLDQLNIPK